MNDPVLFRKCNNLPRRDAEEFLKSNASKVKWKIVGDRSLDIGSADGGVTTGILKRYLPQNYSKLVGCDIGEKMVEYANEHYKDQRTYFITHDLRADVIQEFKENFDHVFSFYTLHWIHDQRHALSNIHRMLAEGGDCLLMILAYAPIYAIYRLMSKDPKWTSYLANAEQFVSPYQDCEDPAKELHVYMEEVGFVDVDVKSQHRSYLYTDVNFLKETMAGICPFKIPKEMVNEYLDDYVETAVKHRLMEEITNDSGEVIGLNYVYTLLWAYGAKS